MTVSVLSDVWNLNWKDVLDLGGFNSISFTERQDTEYTVEMCRHSYRSEYPRILMKCNNYGRTTQVEVDRVSAWKLFEAIAENPVICKIVRDMCDGAIKYREKEKQNA